MTGMGQFMRDGKAHVLDIVIRDGFKGDTSGGWILVLEKNEAALAWGPINKGTKAPQPTFKILKGIGPYFIYVGEHKVDVLAPCGTVVTNRAKYAVVIVNGHV